MADNIKIHLIFGERETGFVYFIQSVPFVVGLSTVNLSHRRPEPA
jgi:hypothetical protein